MGGGRCSTCKKKKPKLTKLFLNFDEGFASETLHQQHTLQEGGQEVRRADDGRLRKLKHRLAELEQAVSEAEREAEQVPSIRLKCIAWWVLPPRCFAVSKR